MAGDPSVERGLRGGASAERWAGKPLADCLPGAVGVSRRTVSENLAARRWAVGSGPPRSAWVLWRRGQRGPPPRCMLASHVNWGLPESVPGG